MKRLVLAALALGAVAALLAFLIGGALVASEPRAIGPAPASLGAAAVEFPSASGATLRGWFVRGEAGKGAVLLLHGVRGDRRDMISRAEFLHARGYAVLLFDFQAHGESSGAQITFGARESHDVAAALRFLGAHAPGERVGVIGVSLGAASFVLSTDRPPVDAVVLESMYPTLAEAVSDRLRLHLGPLGPAFAPLLTVQLHPRLRISIDDLRPIDRIGQLGAPVLIAAGTLDRHTSPAETQAIFAAASEPKELWLVTGAAHVNLHRFAKAAYEQRVGDFLQKHLRP